MKNRVFKTVFCLALSLFGTACKSETETITYGCSGGYTGGGSGVKVINDGRIFKWTSTLEKVSEEELKNDIKLADEAFSRLKKLNITNINYNNPGNYTCTLTVQKNGTSHSVSWSNNTDKKIENLASFSNWLEEKIKNNK